MRSEKGRRSTEEQVGGGRGTCGSSTNASSLIRHPRCSYPPREEQLLTLQCAEITFVRRDTVGVGRETSRGDGKRREPRPCQEADSKSVTIEWSATSSTAWMSQLTCAQGGRSSRGCCSCSRSPRGEGSGRAWWNEPRRSRRYSSYVKTHNLSCQAGATDERARGRFSGRQRQLTRSSHSASPLAPFIGEAVPT